jgi:glycosyltransferase involved in cell wall biosynthesis
MNVRKASSRIKRAVLSRVTWRTGALLVVVLLLASVSTVAVTKSWLALTLALTVLIATLMLALIELRRNRVALRGLRQRVIQSDQEVQQVVRSLRELEAMQAQLVELQVADALRIYDEARHTLGPYDVRIRAAAIPLSADGLLRRGDVLDAYALLTSADALASADLQVLRRLRVGLRDRGYLGRAREVARAIVAKSEWEDDRHHLARLNAQIAVLSGEFNPVIRRSREEYSAIPRRILHVVGRSLPYTQSGYTLRTHYIAVAQMKHGIDPHVVTQAGFAGHDGEVGSEKIDGVAYHRLPGYVRGQVRFDVWLTNNVQRLADLVCELRPAILHAASDFINALTAKIVGRAFGIPVVYESRGFWEETWLQGRAQDFHWNDLGALEDVHGLPDSYLMCRKLEDRLRFTADHVVTLDPVMLDRIASGGVPADRVSVVPNAVDVDRFPILERNEQLAETLGFAPDTLIAGYISSIVPYEGIDTLIDAYAELKRRGKEQVALLIVGNGPALDDLRAQASSIGLEDVVFTGAVPHTDVLDYYSLIDIFVVPRRPVEVCQLVTPLKPFEAFSTGRTVVLSNVRALASIASQSSAAELFEAGSASSLADVLEDLLADPERRRKLAKEGASWVRKERTWETVAAAYSEVYRRVDVQSWSEPEDLGTEIDPARIDPGSVAHANHDDVVGVDGGGEQGVASSLRRLDEFTDERMYADAVVLGEQLLATAGSDAKVLDHVRATFAKAGEVSLQAQAVQMQRHGEESERLERLGALLQGRLRETSGDWRPEISGPPEFLSPDSTTRVLHLMKAAAPYRQSGDTLRSKYVAASQRAAGLEPIVMTYLGFPRSVGVLDAPPEETVDGVRHLRLDMGPDYDLNQPVDRILQDFATTAAPHVRELAPAVIHAHSGFRGYDTALVALALGRQFGLPVVYEVRGFLESTWTSEVEWAERSEIYRRRLATETRCMHEANAVVTLSESMKAEIVGRGVGEDKVHVIPNGVDTDVFRPKPRSEELVKRHRLEDTFTFGYVSNLDHHREGQEALIDAAVALRDRGVRASALIVGDGKRRDLLERYARDRDASGSVVFTGQVPHEQVLDYYALMDVFVIPRIAERAARLVTPLKPLEAMAVGVPLITSDLPALRELTGDGTRGRHFPAGDATALADVLAELAADSGSRTALAQRAREWVIAKRQWAKNGDRYVALYDSLQRSP